jgi:hypothetical protein
MSTTYATVRPTLPVDPNDRPAATATPRASAKGSRPAAPRVRADGVSREARRLAAAILEVLAGVRTPVEAAQQLDISVTRYYIDEGRALQGLVAACAPRPRGRVRHPDNELAALRREGEQLRRQNARLQALLRVAQRTVGLAPTPSPTAKPDRAGGKKRRPRKPTARALKAAAALQEAEAAPTPALGRAMDGSP